MASYVSIRVRSLVSAGSHHVNGGRGKDEAYSPTIAVEAGEGDEPLPPEADKGEAQGQKGAPGMVKYSYAPFTALSPLSSSSTSSVDEPPPPERTHASVQPLQDKVRPAYYKIASGEGDGGEDEDDEDDDADSDDEDDDDQDDEQDDDGHGSYYSTDALAGLSSRTMGSSSSEPSSSSGSWRVIEQQETGDDFAQSEIVRGFAHMDAELMKAAMQRYADSLAPSEAETLLAHITEHARAIAAAGGPLGPGGSRRGSGITRPSALPALAKFPFSYGSQIVSTRQSPRWKGSGEFSARHSPRWGEISMRQSPRRRTSGEVARQSPRWGLSSGESAVGEIGLRDKASVLSQEAPVVVKNTKWNQSYQELIAAGIQNMPLASVKRLVRLANDFVYTCMIYTKIIVNELNMPIDKKTIKPALDIGGIAGGEKYVIQGVLFKFCLDPQVSEKGKGVWLYGGSHPSEEKAAKAAALELQGLSLISSLFLPHLHQPFMALIDFKGFRILATSLLPLGPDTICYGSHDAGNTVHASDPNFNRLMDEIGGLLNLKKHTVGEQKVSIVGPGDIEGHKGLDGRYYLLDYARLFPSQAPIPSEDGTWDNRGVFYQMLRPELVRSFKTPLSSDVFTGWSMYDEKREESEREVIEATQLMLNERIPAVAAELDGLDTSCFGFLYSRHMSELDPHKILQFLNNVNLESRMHRAGINIRHMGRLRQLIHNPELRSFVLCMAISRVLKHKLRNRMRKTVRTIEKRQCDLVSEESCKRVGARILNMILGQHPKSNDFWQRSVVKSLRKRFPFILSPEEQSESYDIRQNLHMRVLFAVVLTQSTLRLTPKASNVVFTDPSVVKLISSDIEAIMPDAKFNPIISLLSAEVSRRTATEEKNRALQVRLLDAARAKLKQAIDAMPSCANLYRSVARVNMLLLTHPEYDSIAEQVFASLCAHLQIAYGMEKTRGALLLWAQALELHAERLEKANSGATTPRAAELRAMADSKRAEALELPPRLTDRDDAVDAATESVLF